MPHLYDNIPAMLRQRPNWVAWGIRDAPPDTSPKSPYNPASLLAGRPLAAKAGVKETWGSYQAAAECVVRGLAQGVGYEFDGGVYGVDLDHVIDGRALSPQAREIVGKLNSYTEVSPSGTGLHIFVLAPGADITRHRKKDYFADLRKNNGEYAEMQREIIRLQEDFPVIPQIMEGDGAVSLSAEEHKALARYLRLKTNMENMERKQIYFRGHADNYHYLKKIGAI